MSEKYTTKTATLRAVKADINKLRIKSPNSKDFINILELLSGGQTFYDDRGKNVTDNDLWGTEVIVDNDNVTIAHNWLSASELAEGWNSEVVSLKNNKVYDADETFIANVESSQIKDGTSMFEGGPIEYIAGNFNNLIIGKKMFKDTSKLSLFVSDLKTLKDGEEMFNGSAITNVDSDLSSLYFGDKMFKNTKNLESFTSNLPSMLSGDEMFSNSALTSFSGSLSYLYNGQNMFANSDLNHFNSSLSTLLNGLGMFENTNLTLKSIETIAQSLPVINEYYYDENGEKVYSWSNGTSFKFEKPIWDNKESDITYGPYQFNISSDTIGEIIITWKNPAFLSDQSKLTILYEHFSLMNLKGWTIATNLSLDEQEEEVYIRTLETTKENATHVSSDGTYYKVYSVPHVLKGKGLVKDTWTQYATYDDAMVSLGLTAL